MNTTLAVAYHSPTQIARVLTENWVQSNMFCPRCGYPHIKHFPNNCPVADFYCPRCQCEYELKSKNGPLGKKVSDGAYDTMIQRISSNRNPDFFFMGYSKNTWTVTDFMVIPKHFFVPDIIEKRKPLASTARRAGWVGCNILLERIPEQGRVSVISHGAFHGVLDVLKKLNRGQNLETCDLSARGWLMDILNCINTLPENPFSLREMYSFEDYLRERHPENNNIRPKIRQQLQLLRDKGFVEFLGNGQYRKL